jgi:hypothetical protein
VGCAGGCGGVGGHFLCSIDGWVVGWVVCEVEIREAVRNWECWWRVVGERRVASRGSGAGTREAAIEWRESLETATQGTENEHLLRKRM